MAWPALGWMQCPAPADTMATADGVIPPMRCGVILPAGLIETDGLLTLLLAIHLGRARGVMQIQSGGNGLICIAATSNTASGLFANANHMATLLLVSIPLLIALGARRWRKLPGSNDRMLTATLTGGAAVVVLLGIVLNQSFALLVIGAPVVAATALQLIPSGRVRLGRLATMLGLLCGGCAVLR